VEKCTQDPGLLPFFYAEAPLVGFAPKGTPLAEPSPMNTPDVNPTDCPQAPAFRASLQTLLLHEACEKAGGVSQFANLLGVSPVSLTRWMDGDDQAPEAVLRACIDILLPPKDPP
jgi:hypothetical protein